MEHTNYRVMNAALDARDALRGRIVPAAGRLRSLIGDNPEAVRLLDEIQVTAGAQADRLRLAFKDRAYRVRGIEPQQAVGKNILAPECGSVKIEAENSEAHCRRNSGLQNSFERMTDGPQQPIGH